MQLSIFLAILSAISAAAQDRTDYFFRFIGGNVIINNLRLRSNSSSTLGVTRSPQNPKDHFKRISIDPSKPSLLRVVPTHPHPPPVPGYYGLSSADNVKDALRIVWSYHPDEDPSFKYKDWDVHRSVRDRSRTLLRYAWDQDQEWRWIAVKEKASPDAEISDDIWVPWYVRPSAGNMATLNGWEYDVVDLELVKTTGAVNSGAPGGVEE